MTTPVEELRRRHIKAARVHRDQVDALRNALVAARAGGLLPSATPTRATVSTKTWREEGRAVPGCDHKWKKHSKQWKGCVRCGLFMARRLGEPPELVKLPAILQQHPLPPPQSDKAHPLYGVSLITRTPVEINKRLRIWQCLATYDATREPYFDVEVKFPRGWAHAGSFAATQWHRIVDACEDFTARDPMYIYTSIQTALYGAAHVSSVVYSLNR